MLIIVRTQDLRMVLKIEAARIVEISPPTDLKDKESPTYQIQALFLSGTTGEFRPYVLASYNSITNASIEFERLNDSILNSVRFFQFRKDADL